MLPLDKYNKDFDLLLVGNLGTKTVGDLLSDSKDTVYLVKRDESSLGSQSHFELIHYIKNNYKKQGEVLWFDVYSPT